MKKIDLERTKKFHQMKSRVPGIVKKFIRKDHVLYGGKAINNQVMPGLRTVSKDFDIFSKTPKEDAKALEKELDKQAGADVFSVEKAKFPKTTKVKDLRGETVADFTQMPPKIKTKNLLGRNIETIDSMLPKIKKTIKSSKNAYRREKDLDNLNRIKLMRDIGKGLR